MDWIWYECLCCGAHLRREDCEWIDDPRSPNGPFLICPACEEVPAIRYHSFLTFVIVTLGIGAGLLVYLLTTR